MFSYLKKEECCGCGSCVAICPKNALSIKPDDEGFSYPVLDLKMCINCDLCNMICQFRHEVTHFFHEPKAYIVRHNDDETLRKSTSGGVFTALSDLILKSGGIVYGAAYDENLNVTHIRACDTKNRDLMRGSKYVQSDITGVYRLISIDLEIGKRVLFVGTPCQVGAVNAFFAKHKNHNNLITCDLLCYGTPSPMVFYEHIKMLESKYQKKVIDYQCRPAQHGFRWGLDNDLAILNDGAQIAGTAWINIYRKLYYSNIDKRPSCHNCKYTKYDRPGDITLGDCKNAARLVPNWNLDNGVSTVLINSPKGQKMFTQMQNIITSIEVDLSDIDQPPLNEPSMPSIDRADFFENLKKNGYKRTIRKLYGVSFTLKYWVKHRLLSRD